MANLRTLLKSPRVPLVIALSYMAIVLGYDLTTPRGQSDWVLYLLAVMLMMRRLERRSLLIVATAASVCTIIGLVFSPPGQPVWISLYSRTLAVVLIWAAVFVGLHWLQADERLRQLETAVAGSADIVFMTDAKGELTFVNPAFTETYGYSADEVVGKATPRILKGGAVEPGVYNRFWEDLLKKRLVRREFVNKTKDGRLVTVEASASAIVDSKGKIVGFLGIQHDVTARNRAEEAVRRSEASLANAQRIAHVGSWDWDIAGNQSMWSEELLRIFGLDPKEPAPLLERSLELIHPDDRGRVESAVKAAMEEGKPYDCDYRIIRPDGAERALHAQGEVQFDSSRKPVRMVGVVQDITERTRAEEAIRNLQRRFSLAFNSAPEPMTISTLSRGIYVDVNESFLRITGYRREEVIGQTSLSIKFWGSTDRRKALLEELKKGPVRDFEIAFLTKSGAVRTGLLSADVISVDRQACLLAVTKDITERKQSEEELKRLNRALRTISECNQALVRANNETGLLESICQILVDHGGFRMAWVGYAQQDKTVRPVAFAGDESGYLAGLRVSWADDEWGSGPTGTCIRTGRPSLARSISDDPKFAPWREEALRRGYASSLALPLVSSGKTLGALVVYSKDTDAFDSNEIALLQELASDLAFGISAMHNRDERAKVEQHLEKTQEQFLQAQKMEAVGRLAGGVAHDFNNLLTVINGYADLLLSQLADDRAVRNGLEEIKKAGDRAAALTRQLLTFSRKQVAVPTDLNLNSVVESMENMLRRLIGEDIKFVLHLGRDLGRVRADAGQIEQVIMNLAVNARDAMPKGGTLVIETFAKEFDVQFVQANPYLSVGEYIVLIVSDTGHGMDAETQSHIFEPFYTTRPKGKGTGLGLSTVYGIVKQSGGHVSVYSEPGRGTTFKVYLPSVGAPMEEGKQPVLKKTVLRGTETILLVEDEPSVRELARGILESNGYTVLVAGEYLEALARSTQFEGTIHLLVTDVIMPGLNGKELADSLLALRPSMKVLFISGYTADAIAQHGILEEGVAYLPKPFVPMELLQKVRATLES